MIDTEVAVFIECDHCSKKLNYDSDTVCAYCEKCNENFPVETMKELMGKVLESREWEDDKNNIGFNNKEEKKFFMKGIIYGINHVFFEYANIVGCDGIEAWEKFDDEMKNSRKKIT